jgi:hypothetical protein
MPLRVFGYTPKRIAVDKIGSLSSYGHTFGGNLEEHGIEVANAPLPLHLIYRLNLADPMLSIKLPGISFLPLIFPFAYGCECGYTILSDNAIAFHQFYNEASPPWDAPREFPKASTSFKIESYNPQDAKDALNYKGIFGWNDLSDSARERAVKIAAKKYGLSKDDAPDDDWDLESVIRCMCDPPFAQRRAPLAICLNPSCGTDADMQVIAMQDKCVRKEQIWPSKFSQTIWQMCSECGSIHVANQCS